MVLNFYLAAMENRRDELKASTAGYSVAVMNALDTFLGEGKGNVLGNWFKAIDAPPDGQAEAPERRVSIPPGTRKFFADAPIAKKAKG